MNEKIEKTIKELAEAICRRIDELEVAVEDARTIVTTNAEDFNIEVDRFGNEIRIRPVVDSNIVLAGVEVPSLDKIGEYVEKAKWDWLHDMVDHIKNLVDSLDDLVKEMKTMTRVEDKAEG